MTDKDTAKLETVRSRIESADLHPDDRELINEYDDGLKHRAKTGDRQHSQHLKRILLVAKQRTPPDDDDLDESQYHGVALGDALTDEDAAKALNDWLDDRLYRGEPLETKTKIHYRTTLRTFGAILTDHGPRNDDVPPAMRCIPGGDPRNRDEKGVTPKPGQILWWDPDVVYIIDVGCLKPRDKALVALGWDSGARPEEILDLTYGDILLDGEFYRITVGSKDHPEDDPLCAVATPYLRDWLKFEHPANDTDAGFSHDTPVWTYHDKMEPLTDHSARKAVERIRNRLDLNKPFSLKWLRKSRASIVAMRDNMSQTKLENRFNWVRGSKVAAAYIARYNDDTDADIAEGDGIPEEYLERTTDDRDDPAPLRCPACEEWTPRHYDACMWCAAEFAHDEAEEADPAPTLREDVEYREKRDRFMRDVVEDDATPEQLELAVEHGDLLDDNDDLAEKALDLQSALDAARDDS